MSRAFGVADILKRADEAEANRDFWLAHPNKEIGLEMAESFDRIYTAHMMLWAARYQQTLDGCPI